MACAGSLFFTNLPPEEPSAAAEEGTAAGEYLERLLTGQTIGTHARNGVFFDDEMKFHVEPLVERIKGLAATPVRCEQRIDFQVTDNVWIRGQYDIGYVGHDGWLVIEDLKYGWGLVEIGPKTPNWQLLGYAIGEFIRRGSKGENFPGVVMRILQPRPHHEEGSIREWRLTSDQLLSFFGQIKDRMLLIEKGLRDLATGPQCRYCKAAPFCPALSKAAFRGVEHAQEFVQDNLSDAELSSQLDIFNRINDVIKIRLDSLKTLTVDRIKNGAIVPNYVTEPSYGDRKWKKSIDPETIKMLTGKDITERVMLSPAKAEKLGISKDFVNGLVDRHFLGMKLNRKDASDIGNKIFGTKDPNATR